MTSKHQFNQPKQLLKSLNTLLTGWQNGKDPDHATRFTVDAKL